MLNDRFVPVCTWCRIKHWEERLLCWGTDQICSSPAAWCLVWGWHQMLVLTMGHKVTPWYLCQRCMARESRRDPMILRCHMLLGRWLGTEPRWPENQREGDQSALLMCLTFIVRAGVMTEHNTYRGYILGIINRHFLDFLSVKYSANTSVRTM